MGWEQDLIDAWCTEYGINKIHFLGYADDLGEHPGEARYNARNQIQPWMGIGVSSRFAKHKSITKCILWHELYFCCKNWGPKFSPSPERFKNCIFKVYFTKPLLCIGWLLTPVFR